MPGLNSPFSSARRAHGPARLVLALAAACLFAADGHAAPTRVALLSDAAELSGLTACLGDALAKSGPLARADAFPEGLEFRLLLRTVPGQPGLLVVQGLLKPDVAGLVESHNHDDDPEGQPEAARRFFHLLRIPLDTRVWAWQPARQAAICTEAAEWVDGLRRRPILFDRLGEAR